MTSSLLISIYSDNSFRFVDLSKIIRLQLSKLCEDAYVFRFSICGYGNVYFTEHESPYAFLKNEGKNVQFLHQLFEAYRRELILRGYPSDKSISSLTLDEITTIRNALKVFPSSQVEVLQ